MSEHYNLFIQHDGQKIKPSNTRTANPQPEKPVALFNWHMLLQEMENKLSQKEWDKIYDTLCPLFEEADKEDLYGKLFKNDDEPDYILNENEQKNFLALVKEKYPKMFNMVNKFVENLHAGNDAEIIVSNFDMKIDGWSMTGNNEQLLAYNLRFLNNENLMAVSDEYRGPSLLYSLYEDAKERADTEIPEFNPDFWFDDGEERTAEKIKEYQRQYEIGFKASIMKTRKRGKKDLETIKAKSVDYVDYLIQFAKNNNVYYKDYEKEIIKAINNNDIKNLTIFTQRLSDRIFMFKDKNEKRVEASKRAIELKDANGEIDTTFIQGYTGDCWILSPLKSMSNDKKFLEKINKMITVNKENGVIKSVTINIQGKNYTFDYKNIKSANEYSSGDLDVRVMEMALNQYVHENNLCEGDITLGWDDKDAYKIILGEDNIEITDYKTGTDGDFDRYLKTLKQSSSGTVSTIGITNDWNEEEDKEKDLFAEDKNGNKVELFVPHAYNYVKIDDKYLYFTDPQEPLKELRMPLKKVGRVFDDACIVKLKDNKD